MYFIYISISFLAKQHAKNTIKHIIIIPIVGSYVKSCMGDNIKLSVSPLQGRNGGGGGRGRTGDKGGSSACFSLQRRKVHSGEQQAAIMCDHTFWSCYMWVCNSLIYLVSFPGHF